MAQSADVLSVEMRAKDRASKEIEKVRRLLGGLTGAVTGFGRAQALAAAVGGGAFVLMVTKAVKAAAEERKGIEQLSGALARAGSSWAEAGDSIEAFAVAQQRATQFGDDVSRAVLTRLVNLTGSYSEATLAAAKAAMDFAQANGVDAASAASLVGKAASGSATILQGYGISLTDAQRKALESSDAGERLAAVTEALSSKFGGAAAQIDPVSLGLARVHNGMGDLLETFGMALTGTSDFGGALGRVADLFVDLDTAVRSSGGAIGTILVEGLRGALAVGQFFVVTLGEVHQGIKAISNLAGPFGEFLKQLGLGAAALKQAPYKFLDAEFRGRITASYDVLKAAVSEQTDDAIRLEGEYKKVADTLGLVSLALAKFQKSGETTVALVGPPAALVGGVKKTGGGGTRKTAPVATGVVEVEDEGLDLTDIVAAQEALDALRAAVRSFSLDIGAVGGAAAPLFADSLDAIALSASQMQEALDEGLLTAEDVEAARERLSMLSEDWEEYRSQVRAAEEATASATEAVATIGSVFRDQVAPFASAAIETMGQAMADLVAGSATWAEDLAANMLNAIGRIASSMGQMLVLSGFVMGPGAIAAGIGLLALGATLSGLSSRVAGGARGGGRRGAAVGTFRDVGRTRPGEDTSPAPQVTVNFGGRAFMTQEEVARAISLALGRGERAGVLATAGAGFRR